MKKILLSLCAAALSAHISFTASIKGIRQIEKSTQLDEILSKGKPVVALFSTSWCGPCKMIAPTIEQLIEEHPDVLFCYIDGDNGALAPLKAKHNVQAYPTIIFFNKSGKQIGENMRGAQSKAMIKRAITSISSSTAITPSPKMAVPKKHRSTKNRSEETLMHEVAPMHKMQSKKTRTSRASVKKSHSSSFDNEYSESCPVKMR